MRGTGEILRANESFARMVGVPRRSIAGTWKFCQFLTEEALVNFCEKVVAMYFDTKQHTLITNCVLVPGGARALLQAEERGGTPSRVEKIASHLEAQRRAVRLIPCGISATVRRDMFNLPVLVGITMIPMVEIDP